MHGLALLALGLGLVQGDPWPLTRAERTEYRETSHHADVLAFLDQLQKLGAPYLVQTIGQSTGGKDIPLVIASIPPVHTPEQARRSGKPIVYVQANIHAGEVEGKEVVLMMLRDMARKPKGSVLEKIVLVTTPIYNSDGNDAFGPQNRNRGSQNGPDPIGQRPNGQGLDLNRDCMKAESPEMRAVLANIYNRWDPDVIMDLHTTNGTRHGYPITYSPPLHPDTDPGILAYSRDELLPQVRRELRRTGLETLDYGNLSQNPQGASWLVFGWEGRYVTNYAGLRNRIGVLSEALSYCPFPERVDVTRRFVDAVLAKVGRDGRRIVAMTRAADARMIQLGTQPQAAPPFGVRFEMADRGVEDVLVERPRPQGSPRTVEKPTDLMKVKARVFDRFKATETERFPTAYVLPAEATKAVELLARHGIVVEVLTQAWQTQAQEFLVSEVQAARSAFQGHNLKTVLGSYGPAKPTEFRSGAYLVRTAQPLGVLLFNLAEPKSLDGLAAWDFLDGMIAADKPYPVRRTHEPVRAVSRIVPGPLG